MVFDVFPRRGSFEPGMPIQLQVENWGNSQYVKIVIKSYDTIVSEQLIPLTNGSQMINLPAIPCEYGGFGVEAVFLANDKEVATRYTAFDYAPVNKVVRYGFLSDFSPEDTDSVDIVCMSKMHINAVQFYDWSCRHDNLVPQDDVYMDMMGKVNSLSSIRRKIQLCHEYGMQAIGYGAIYAASEAYQRSHPDQSLFDRRGQPLCFIDTFYIMNIAKESDWHTHIIDQYQRAISEVGFDGIHMDTYGFPKEALNSAGEKQYLAEQIPSLIDNAYQVLSQKNKRPWIIFNHVGGWPLNETREANLAATYIEVWPPRSRYRHLGEIIELAKRSSDRPVIIAAYPAPFRTESPEEAIECQLLLSFVIAMYGATQLFLGENRGVITQGYYADYSRISKEQFESLRAYQDFFVRYEEIFLDRTLMDVSMTHQAWDNHEYMFEPEGSADGEGNTLWFHIRQNKTRKIVCVVNLLGNNDLWNEGKCRPPKCEITCTIQVLRQPSKVYYASPDQKHGELVPIGFRWVQTDQGDAIRFQLNVYRCGFIVIE